MAPKCLITIVAQVVWTIVCLTGFIFQSREVCNMYFQYKTTTSIELVIPEEISIPSISICSRYADILDRSEHQRYGLWPELPRPSSPTYFKQIITESSLLTIRQLFNLTPAENSTVVHCLKRSVDMFEMVNFDQRDCLDQLNISKYYVQEFICYLYSFKSTETLALLDISHSLHWPRISYEIDMVNMSNARYVTFIVDPGNRLPIFSRNFGKTVRLEEGIYSHNLFHIYYRLHEIHRLPPPYESMCTMVREEDAHECKGSCLIREMRVIERFPSSEMTFDPVDLKHVNSGDFKNTTRRKFMHDANQGCKAQCSRNHCSTFFATTSISSALKDIGKNKHRLHIRMMIPDEASIVITLHGKMNLVDFIVYMGSSLGMWFGLSVTAMPASLLTICKLLPTSNKTAPAVHHRVELILHFVTAQQEKIAKQQRQIEMLMQAEERRSREA